MVFSFFKRSLDELLFEITFSNSRGGLLFEMNRAINETVGFKTMSKTITQIFSLEISLKVKYSSRTRYLLSSKEAHGLLPEIKPTGASFSASISIRVFYREEPQE